MTRAEALGRGRAMLAASPTAADPSPTPALDASLILASLLGIGRERLLAGQGEALDAATLAAFEKALAKRASGIPVAYLIGEKEFYGRIFSVNEAVLVPRPDTELLVELALREGDRLAASLGRPPHLHECCVGSGAVAVSIAAERPSWIISASDISAPALEIASHNASRLLPVGREGGPLRLFASDLLAGIRGPYDLILANPPYVESSLARELAEGWGEPLLALDGGPDGLLLLRRLISEAQAKLAPGGLLLVEADGSQARTLRELLSDAGLVDTRSERDLAGIERVTIGAQP